MKRALVGLCLVLSSSIAWALPSEQQVQDQVKQGNYTQAESMMSDVVSAKPNNAKAHYVYAELLAHNGNFNKAAGEIAKVRQIDPNYGSNDAAFKSFVQTLQREQSPPSRTRAAPTSYNAPATISPASASPGLPSWVWIIGLLVVAMVLWRGFMRSRAASVGPMAPAGFNGGYGPGQTGAAPYGPYGPGGAPVGGGGSGMLGTGLAVAGGVAGGMLLDEMLHKRSDGGAFNPGAGGFDNSGSDSAARELEDRPVDFGSGGDWDSGGGGVDMGGGGGSDGGNWE